MRSKLYSSLACAWLILLSTSVCLGQMSTINFNVAGPADWNTADNWIVPGVGVFVPGDGFVDEVVGISNGGTAVLNAPAAFPIAGMVIGESGQFPDGGPELGTLEVSGNSTTLTVALTGVADSGNVRLGDDGTGFLNVSGGVLNFQNDFFVGNGGRGVVTMTGGALVVGDDMRVRDGLGPDVSALLVSGSATIDVNDELDLDRLATIRGPDANLLVGGRLRVLGTLNPVITSPTDHSTIMVGGAAQLNGGTVRPEFDGVTPQAGDSWTLINADSAVGTLTVDASAAPALPRGLFYIVELNQGASVDVDLVVTNRLILTVDRASGVVAIENVIGDPIEIDGYSIGSAAGTLNPAGWNSLEGAGAPDWREIGSPSANQLAELNPTGSSMLSAGSQLSMGDAFQFTSFGQPDDLDFQYTEPDSGNVISGIVEYNGPHNNLVLTVDPTSGEAVLENQSAFQATIDGYIISSPSGSLLAADGQWNSLKDQAIGAWEEARPTEFNLSELNPTGATAFNTGTSFNLGTLFDVAGPRDLGLEFHLAGIGILTGIVEYGELAPIGLSGDTNGDGIINIDDLNNVRNNFGAMGTPDGTLGGDAFPFDGLVNIDDLNAVRNNFGAMSPAPVPEPRAFLLLVMGCVALILGGRRRHSPRRMHGTCVSLFRWNLKPRYEALTMASLHQRQLVVILATSLLAVFGARPGADICRAAEIAYVVDPDALIDGAFDMFWANRLTGQGHTVTGVNLMLDPITDPSLANVELFIISNDIASGDLNPAYTADLRPSIVYETASYDALGFSNDNGDTQAETSLNFIAPVHPIANGLSGDVDVYSVSQNIARNAVDINPNADVVAMAGDRASIAVLEPGDALIGPTGGVAVAPAIRITAFVNDGGDGNAYTASGLTLLDNMVSFALGFEPPVLGDVNGDGSADLLDFEVIRINFGIGTTREEGDLDFDNNVSLSDFKIWKQAAFPPGAAAVPEPSTLTLASVLSLFVLAYGRVTRVRCSIR